VALERLKRLGLGGSNIGEEIVGRGAVWVMLLLRDTIGAGRRVGDGTHQFANTGELPGMEGCMLTMQSISGMT
jgi:hypothetical protein